MGYEAEPYKERLHFVKYPVLIHGASELKKVLLTDRTGSALQDR
jgi:hypothetical protein